VQARPGRSREDALLIVRWLLDAGDPVPGDLTMEAGAAAVAAGDPELGERLGRMALDEGSGSQAALLVARACAVRQRYEEAEAVLAPLEGTFEAQEPAIAYLQQRVAVLLSGLRRPKMAWPRVHPPLAALRGECDARLAAAYIDDAAARAARDPVLACADEFEAIGALRYASECATVAAEIFADAGRQDSARRASARSRELHRRCQGSSAPEVRGLAADGLSLTERERQLVDLAAQGLSNAEIADRFVLSVRTVESYLYRAMQKLGVKDRRDLRAGVG
jgi:DNA-binding CsgD family transcriptional regulator